MAINLAVTCVHDMAISLAVTRMVRGLAISPAIIRMSPTSVAIRAITCVTRMVLIGVAIDAAITRGIRVIPIGVAIGAAITLGIQMFLTGVAICAAITLVIGLVYLTLKQIWVVLLGRAPFTGARTNMRMVRFYSSTSLTRPSGVGISRF